MPLNQPLLGYQSHLALNTACRLNNVSAPFLSLHNDIYMYMYVHPQVLSPLLSAWSDSTFVLSVISFTKWSFL